MVAFMRASLTTIILTAIWLLFPTRGADAATIPVEGALDCSTGTVCTISGIGGNPLFSGSASTGDVLDIKFAGGAYFQPILDDQSLVPWEVSMGGQGTNNGDNFATSMYLSDISGNAATGTAGLSLNGLLAFTDGVSFLALPILVFDLHIAIGNNGETGTSGTANFTLNSFSIVDRPNEGPVITFEQGALSEVPLPPALALYGTGLGLVALFGWWRRRSAVPA
jgi:hypothetical protein